MTYFPQAPAVEIGRDVLFQLKCHKFVEMMRDYSEQARRLTHPKSNDGDPMSGDSSSDENDDKLELRPPSGSFTSTSSVTSSPAASDQRASGMDDKGDMDLGDSCHYMDVDEDENDADSSETNAIMQRIMAYGQQLQNEYRHDDRPMVRDKLLEIFSLLAYPDPYTSPTAHILDVSERHALASSVNSALLGTSTCAKRLFI